MLFSRSSRRRTRISALPLLFLTVLGLLIGGLGAPAYAATVTVSGAVTGKDGAALSGVTVKLGTLTGTTFTTVATATPSPTGATGAWSATVDDGAQYVVQYTHAGYDVSYFKSGGTATNKPGEATPLDVTGGKAGIDARLVNGSAEVSGTVKRKGSLAQGPLGGVKVELLSGGAVAAQATTSDDAGNRGAYRIDDVLPGTYTLRYSGGGLVTSYYVSASDSSTAPAAATTVTLSSGQSKADANGFVPSDSRSEIGGKLTTTGGAAISGAQIRVYKRSAANAQTGDVTYTPELGQGTHFATDANGAWGPLDLEFGSWLLEVRAPAYGTYYLSGTGARSTDPATAPLVEVKVGEAQTINASLPAASTTTITGQVKTASGSPIQGVTVSVEYPSTNASGQTVWNEVQATRATTAADGTYTANVPPTTDTRTYVVGFLAPGFRTQYFDAKSSREAATQVSATFAAPRAGVDAVLTPATQVAGKVRAADGSVLSGVKVTAVVLDPAATGARRDRWVTLKNGGNDVTTTTELDGTFRLDVPKDTPFRLSYAAAGRETRYYPSAVEPDEGQNITVAENEVVTGRDATLPVLAQLGGSVVEADGSAYTSGGAVELWRRINYTDNGEKGGPSHSTWVLVKRAALSNTGGFSFTTESGSYRLRADLTGSVQGFLPDLVGLDEAAPVTLQPEQVLSLQQYAIPRKAQIRGKVTNLNGAPQSAKSVRGFYRYVTNIVDGAPVLSDWIGSVPAAGGTTQADGSYTLTLRPRTYRVGVDGEGFFTKGTSVVTTVEAADDVRLTTDVAGIDFSLNSGKAVNIQPPFVTGVAQDGETLTANPGAWSAMDGTPTYKWQYSKTPSNAGSWVDVVDGNQGAIGSTPRTLVIPTRCEIPALPIGCNSEAPWAYRVVVTMTRGQDISDPAASLPTSVAASMFGSTTTENRQLPQITGKVAVGETLTATDGVWSEGGTFTYQWFVGGQPIAGATSKTLVVGKSQRDKQLSFKVTETSSNPDREATSALTAPVTKGVLVASVKPSITGNAHVGGVLTAAPGTWNEPAPTFAYQWLANGQVIPGATSDKYTVAEGDLGRVIAVRVTASVPDDSYSPGVSQSDATAAIVDDPTKVVSKTKPIVSGTAKVGETLSTTDGTWSNEPTGFAYQWLADGTAVTGATSSTFVLTKDQRGKKMSVRVTASKSGLTSGTATSEETAAVAGGPLENKTKPTITGQTLEGATLTADPGTWEPETVTPVFTYQWVADGANIAGATSRTYTLTSAEVGKTVTVKVTASANGFDSGTATSAGVGPIDEPQGEITVTGGPSIAGTDTVGELLSLNPGSVTPGDAAITVQWFRDGTAITGATARTYRLVAADEDALITARVTYAQDDFVTLVKSTSAVGPVEPRAEEPDPVKPTLKTSKKIKGKKLVVKVRVFADSQDPVTGQVKLKEGKAFTVLKTLNNGKKKLVVKGLKKGYHSVKLTFLGNDLVKKKSKTLNFTIR